MAFEKLTPLDVTDWPTEGLEQRGKRYKAWVTRPSDGSSWLRKSVSEKPPRPHEHMIEVFTLELARQSGVEAALAFPCTWTECGQTRHGLISQYFAGKDEFLISGAEILSVAIAPYQERGVAYKHAYSLDMLIRALPGLEEVAPGSATALLKVLTFDAWVGNGDRHAENWSLVCNPRTRILRLAPMYDPAACLGSELQDEQVNPLIFNENRLKRYVENCPSGFGDGRSRILRMSEVVETLVELAAWQSNIDLWVLEFGAALDSLNRALSEGVSWLPESRQSLALRLLECRLQRLLGALRCA